MFHAGDAGIKASQGRAERVAELVLGGLACLYVGFHVANLFISFGPIGAKIIHVCLGAVILSADLARRPGVARKAFCLLIVLTVVPAAAHFLSDQVGVLTRYGFGSRLDIVSGAIIVLWMLGLTAVYFGPAFTVVGLTFFAYAYLGSYMPAPLTAPAIDYMRVTSKLTVGAMGDVVELSATVIFLVLFFGALFQASGAGNFIWRIAEAIGKKLQGGTGAIAVSASAFVASFTGVGAATTAISAPIAISIMKRDGYSSEQAAAIEAIASTGGQITPPILGLAAFLMADFLGIPYATIVLAAILPACLFYGGLLAYVSLEYRKRAKSGVPSDVFGEVQDAQTGIVRAALAFMVPMGVLIGLIAWDFSVQWAVLGAIVSVIVLAVILGIEWRAKVWMQAIVDAAITGAAIAMAAGVLDVLMTSLDITQLGMLVGFVVGELAGNSRIGTLVLLIVAAYIMGMGMPGIAIYTVLAITLVPTLTSMGVDPMVSHFLIMYMIIMSNFTPPVAPTLMITVTIAGAKYMKAGVEAMKAGVGSLILPFLIFLYPALLIRNATIGAIFEAFLVSTLTIFLMTVGLVGWFGRALAAWERFALFVAPFLACAARYYGDKTLYWAGLAALGSALVWLLRVLQCKTAVRYRAA